MDFDPVWSVAFFILKTLIVVGNELRDDQSSVQNKTPFQAFNGQSPTQACVLIDSCHLYVVPALKTRQAFPFPETVSVSSITDNKQTF
jgi:hypothetical protein